MNCPVCDSSDLDSLIDLGKMPLSVLGICIDPTKSVEGKTHSIDIWMCRKCSHVFNEGYDRAFKQSYISGCTMYNKGGPWAGHMQYIARYIEGMCDGTIVEIGAGNGEFAALLKHLPYIAYEPTDDALVCAKYVETRQRYYDIENDIRIDKPDVILMRHVLEHYANPGEFLQQISDACRRSKIEPSLIIEVPNIQNALRDVRIEDWVYEHPQHFTPNSLYTLAACSGWRTDDIFTTYNDEVIVASFLTFGHKYDKGCSSKFDAMLRNISLTRGDIERMHQRRSGSVVLWGGAGKGATLINLLDLDIPVIDSDDRKWGKYVPGTPYQINNPSILRDLKPDLVVVTTSWRVKDIVEEIIREEYPVGRVSNFCHGKLITYQG